MFEYAKRTARIGGEEWELKIPELHYVNLADVTRVVMRAAQSATLVPRNPGRESVGAKRVLHIDREAHLLMRDGSTVVLSGNDVGRLARCTCWGLGNAGPPSLREVPDPKRRHLDLLPPGLFAHESQRKKPPAPEVGGAPEASEGLR